MCGWCASVRESCVCSCVHGVMWERGAVVCVGGVWVVCASVRESGGLVVCMGVMWERGSVCGWCVLR